MFFEKISVEQAATAGANLAYRERMTMKSSITEQVKRATNGQKKQIIRVCEDAASKAAEEAVDEALLTLSLAQKILAKGNELQAELKLVIGKFICGESIKLREEENTASDQFADEEVPSRYGYLSGYKPGVMDIDRQITALQGMFPGLNGTNPEYLERVKSGSLKLPETAEKFAAIPNWKKHSELFGATYNDALQKILGLIVQARDGNFDNYRKGQIGPDRLRQSKKAEAYWNKTIEEQDNPDILIVPIQFGLLHRGRSVRRAREVMRQNEVGLVAFAVGICLLTHPERLQHYDDLWIDCAGDEYDDPDSGVRFDLAPCFGFDGVKLRFGADWFGSASGFYGSASAVLPQ